MNVKLEAFLDEFPFLRDKRYADFMERIREGSVERLDDEVLEKRAGIHSRIFDPLSRGALFDKNGELITVIGLRMKPRRFIFWKWEEPVFFVETIYEALRRCDDKLDQVHYCAWVSSTFFNDLVVYKLPKVPSFGEWVMEHEARIKAAMRQKLESA